MTSRRVLWCLTNLTLCRIFVLLFYSLVGSYLAFSDVMVRLNSNDSSAIDAGEVTGDATECNEVVERQRVELR
jgi:hypothetical protein